jgi:1-acyl-sn-glycerol-3-phosphate acyltransferase
MGAKLDYRGREILQNETRPCIIVGNHQENYDTFIIGYMSTPKTVSIGKRSILLFPIFGLVYWLAGNILINRKSRSEALKTMDQAGQDVVDNNLKVLIMPEGTRSRGKGLQTFKKGAFHLAVKFGMPVIPIAVSSYSHLMDLKKLNWGTIKLQALDPIEPDGTDRDAIVRLRDKCYEAVKKGVEQLDSEND